ncbi:uncharacterized protein [Henckelia pumila]|uniref:uncharacterized protein n=1 Tax=Henckelia pumila TaxID=405737 RepID=UPI003C6E4940
MDSGCKGQAWVDNLRHRFSTFCSEADEIICQDSVKYVRTKLITVGENLMNFCSEIVEDVITDFSVDSAGENGPASPTQEQDGNFPAQKMLSIHIDTEQDGKSCEMNSSSTLLSIKPLGERCTDIQYDGKDEVSNHFGKQSLDEHNNAHELPDDEVTCSSSGSTKTIQSNEFDQPSCCQKLEESIIMVNSDECYSDLDMETNYLSLENTKVKFCTLKKKIGSEHSFRSASQAIYSETDRMTEKCCTELPCATDSRVVNEDFCDWEII